MSENQPIKPEAKHKHQPKIPLRPTTEGHNVKDIDPNLERNQPSFTKDKLALNLDAKPFKSSRIDKFLKNPQNNPENFAYGNNGYNPNYNQNHYNYGNNMPNMNMNPVPQYAIPPHYPQPIPYQNFNPHFNNNQREMQMYPGPAPYYPQNYPHFNQNMMYQNNMNNNYNNRPSGYRKPNNINRENAFPPKQTEVPTNNKTNLDLNSKAFVPRSKQEKKEENSNNLKLNINAPPYQPQNTQLKEKENLAHSNKEEKKETQKPKNPLDDLLSDSPKKTSDKLKTSTSKDLNKNSSNLNKKKSGKKGDIEKKIKKEEEERKIREEEERKRREEEERKRREEEKKRKEEEERKIREEEERKQKEEEERKKREEEKIIEKKYFITFKNQKSPKNEKFTFEYILQFRKWKICSEDDLLTKEVKTHFEGFKEEIREGGKKKKDREDTNRKKDNYTKNKTNKETVENKKQTNTMEKWARIDLSKEIKAAEQYKQKLTEEKKQDVLKKDLRNLLNLLTHDNYPQIKKEILEKIKDNVEYQNQFLEVLFQKAVLEKAFVKLYSKLVKELDKDLPQKNKRKEKEGEKKKKEYSEMRARLIDKCKTIFQFENNEQFDQYIKEKDGEERRNKLKKFFLGNAYFITELMKIKILSKKVGPDCLRNLFERYQNGKLDNILKEITLEAIIVFSENFGRIIYEEKTMKLQDKEEFNKKLDEVFAKLEKIKDEPNLVGYIKYNIVNLLEKRKNNFAMSKFDESLIAKTKEQVEKEMENEGKITQENINQKIKKELKEYKECYENKDENQFSWNNTEKIMEKRITYGTTFGDILEGFFEAAAEIIEEEKNHEYIKKFISELIIYYYDYFKKKDILELKERIIALYENILDISLDIPNIFDIYAYVLNIFIDNDIIKFSDLSGLKKEEVSDENLSATLKYLSEYYGKDDFKEKIKEISFVKEDNEKFKWAFE